MGGATSTSDCDAGGVVPAAASHLTREVFSSLPEKFSPRHLAILPGKFSPRHLASLPGALCPGHRCFNTNFRGDLPRTWAVRILSSGKWACHRLAMVHVARLLCVLHSVPTCWDG